MQLWVIVLAPWEWQQSTKTGQFGETISLDDLRVPWLGPLMGVQVPRRLRAKNVVEDDSAIPLWSFTAKR